MTEYGSNLTLLKEVQRLRDKVQELEKENQVLKELLIKQKGKKDDK